MKKKKKKKKKRTVQVEVVEATRSPTGVLRNEKGQLVKGTVSANPAGRPILHHTKMDKLLEAVSRVEMARGKILLDHFINRAFRDDGVLVALMKKLHPDLKAIELSPGAGQEMNTELAESIQKKLAERWEKKP